jgi:hypothetical protein
LAADRDVENHASAVLEEMRQIARTKTMSRDLTKRNEEEQTDKCGIVWENNEKILK